MAELVWALCGESVGMCAFANRVGGRLYVRIVFHVECVLNVAS